MAVSTNKIRSDANSANFAQVTEIGITSGKTVTISGKLTLSLSGADTFRPAGQIPVSILKPGNKGIGDIELVTFYIKYDKDWVGGYAYGYSFSVTFDNDSDGYNGKLVFEIDDDLGILSWTYPNRPITDTNVSWPGYSSSTSTDPDDDDTLTVTYPSAPTTFKTSTGISKYKTGANVTLVWSGASFGDYSNNYRYELFAGDTLIYSGTETSYSIALNGTTTYTIYCKTTSGLFSGSGKTLILYVPTNNTKAIITGVGKSNSNPGFSEKGVNSFNVKWKASSAGKNNSVVNYSILVDDKEVKNNISETAVESSVSVNSLSNKSYKIQVKTYDEVGNYVISDACYLYTVSPEFNSEPSSESSVLLETTTIRWDELKTNSLNSDLLTTKYSLEYAVVGENGLEAYNPISTNEITTNSYQWINEIDNGTLISLKVIGKVYYGSILISQTEKETSNGNYLFKGNLPIKFSEIIFSIPNGDYYGDSSPMSVEYNVDTKEWNLNNSILNFANSLSVQCKMPSSWTESDVYFDGVKIKWKKGLYSGEIIQSSSSGMENPFIFILNEINAPLLFGASGESIRFEIYSLYETKKADESPTGIYIYSDESSLSFDDYPGTNGFIRANLPSIFNNGTSIPTINSTFTRNVNFLENTLGSEDYQLKDLRADNVISEVPVVGFKIYATKDKDDYKNGQIVNVDGYLKQTNGTVTFEDNFYKISNSLIPSGNQSAEETTPGFVGFYPQILDDKDYLRQLFFGNTSTSLQTLSTNETFYYIITAIDALKQESKGYVLEVKYDFRLAAKFQDSPILRNNSFSEVTINQKTGYLFYGQTEDGADWIIFEWYPAFNQNDYLANPDNYIFYNNKYYLKYSEENYDPNFYTLYKWIDNGKVYSKKLINTDYITEIETIEGVSVQKYVGKYQMNLKDINVDEFFNLTLMPSYIDSYNEEKMDTPRKDLYPISEINEVSKESEAINFYLSCLVPASINYDSNERKQGEKFKITLEIKNWGFSDDERIFEKTAVMKLNNSSLTNGYIEKNLVIDDEYESKLLIFNLAEQLDSIYDNMPFSTVTTVKIIATRSLVSNYTYTTGTSTIVTIFNYYLPANFSTLSLRKNKVGINYSDLTNVEEALYVVAKDRIDSGNETGNVAVYDKTYPHVFSIQGNLDTKMPSFSKESGVALSTLQEASIYMGFYTVNDESKPYRVGSFGIEEGQPYFVYKGKYYSDTTIGKNNCEKCYDNKDYFEKISIRNLPVPPGTMVLYPRKNLEENDNGQLILSQNKLKLINPTWYICDGNQTVILENNANLIKAIFPETEWEGKSETYEFTIPRRAPVGMISTEPIYAENGTTITGYIEKDISDEYCYIIKGDA